MARTVRIEKRRRGIFGWIFLLLFWGFNLLMAWAFFAGIAAMSDAPAPVSEAEKAGAAIGTALGISMILGIWGMGALILGLFVMFTRGPKTVIETTED